MPCRSPFSSQTFPKTPERSLRLCACLDVAAHIIEPAGFPTSDRHFRRRWTIHHVNLMRHDLWSKFEEWRKEKGYRLVLFTTKVAGSYSDYRYAASDILLFGRESAGVTDEVVGAADARLAIPIREGCARSTSRWRPPWRWARRCGKPVPRFEDLVSYAVKEIFLTLQGEGMPPRGGVLPFRRLQPLERP